MRFGLCAWSFSNAFSEAGRSPDPMTPLGLAEIASGAGLEAVEVASRWFESGDDELRERFVAELAKKGLAVVVDTGGTSVPEDLGKAVEDALVVAAGLGSRVVRTTVSQCLEGDRSRYGYDGWREHLAALVAPFKKAAARGSDLGVSFGVENHQDICSAELLWLCEKVDSPSFGVVMDCGNALAVGEHPATFAERVMPYLKHVHLKDYEVYPTPSGWRFVRCPLGAGVVDFKDLITRFVAAPEVLGCIELGASSARHVKLLEEAWWESYDPRPWQETLAAIRALRGAEKPVAAEWRTPRELGEEPGAIAAYELEQFEASVRYLEGLCRS